MTLTTRLLKHLDDAAIEAVLHLCGESATKGDSPSTRLADDALVHLAECSECDQRLRMHRDAHHRLEGLRLAQQDATAGICSETVDWTSVAADLLPEVEVRTHLEHASKCAHCGYLLKTAIADLSEVTTPEEDSILASLESTTPEWQLALANKIGSAQVQSPPSKRFKWRFLLKPPSLIFATVLLLVVAGMLGISRYGRSTSPMDLIASAYSEHRTMDLRISGAAYAPKQVERGPAGSSVDRPVALQRAEQLIHEGLLKNPNDVDLLDAKARADMLDGSPGAAIESLELALNFQPDSQILKTDLATAYLMHGDREGLTKDYEHANNLLGEVLAKSPKDSVALFNKAITEDRLKNYSNEIQYWRNFLSADVEKDRGWATEGQTLYELSLKKNKLPKSTTWSPQQSPSSALSTIRARTRGSPSTNQDAPFDEVYLSDAISHWLPSIASAMPASDRSLSEDVTAQQEAVWALADEIRIQHQDVWLSDLLAGQHSPTWKAGIRELANAALADSHGKISDIVPHAVRAIELFRSTNNPAGESASRYEYLIGINRTVQANLCRKASQDAIHLSRDHRYIWIEANTLLEASTCSFTIGRQEAALDYAREAETIAQRSNYAVLELDGAFFLDGVATTSVASSDAWNRIQSGLTEFWRGPYPPLSGVGFYTDLGFALESEGLWYAAESAFQESLAVSVADGNEFTIASTHHRLATAAEGAGDDGLAEGEYRLANQMLSGLGEGAKLAQIEFQIERAALEISQNRFAQADAHLKAIAVQIPTITNHYALIPYYESMGELHLDTGKPEQAEKELLAAIQLTEQDKESLLSETDLLTWHRETSQAYRSLLRLYSQYYHDDSRAFSLLEWYRAGPLRAVNTRRHPNNSRTSEKQKIATASEFLPHKVKLQSQTVLLTWISFPTSMSLFLLNESGLHSAATRVSESTFNATARNFLRLCANPRSDRAALDRDARQLYQWLIQPFSDQLSDAQELVIEPDDSFSYIPFELLETSNGRYLGDSFSIAESPGIGYSRLAKASARISSSSVALAVGDPVLSGKTAIRFQPLPETSWEATSIAANFDRHFVLTGVDANLQNLHKLLPQSEIFHFAGHAASEGNETGLVLSSSAGQLDKTVLLDEKQLRREDMKELRLVVLSGCETGIAEQGLVDPESLVRVFLRGGVPQVVASRWQIDSQSSAELMTLVYTGLMHGTPIHEALTSAKRTLRSKPGTAHPYYWASFSVFGN